MRFDASDYPARPALRAALDEVNLELAEDYEGSSTDPFMTEAFNHALRLGRFDVFVNSTVRASQRAVPELEAIPLRFGIDLKDFQNIQTRMKLYTNGLGAKASAYYCVMVALSILESTTGGKKAIRPTMLSHCMAFAKSLNKSPIFSSNQIINIFSVYETLMAETSSVRGDTKEAMAQNLTAQLCVNFPASDVIKIIAKDINAEKVDMVVRLKVHGIMETVDEILENVETVPMTWLEKLFEDVADSNPLFPRFR
jgi:hypothetical protein